MVLTGTINELYFEAHRLDWIINQYNLPLPFYTNYWFMIITCSIGAFAIEWLFDETLWLVIRPYRNAIREKIKEKIRICFSWIFR
jgi:hypothetical protein